MELPFGSNAEPVATVKAMKIRGTVAGLFRAEGKSFVTSPVAELALTFEGIPGDVHAGFTRRSGGREPWYPRGTEMCNERQVSILSVDELRTIARRLDIDDLKSEWIGGNLLLEGIEAMTMLPPRTVLFFDGGVSIRIDGDNAPCRASGRSIAGQFDGREDIELSFAKVARDLRGLVGFIEKPGTIKVGEGFEARIPPQRLYQPS